MESQVDVRPALDGFRDLADRLVQMPLARLTGKSNFAPLSLWPSPTMKARVSPPFFLLVVERLDECNQVELSVLCCLCCRAHWQDKIAGGVFFVRLVTTYPLPWFVSNRSCSRPIDGNIIHQSIH